MKMKATRCHQIFKKNTTLVTVYCKKCVHMGDHGVQTGFTKIKGKTTVTSAFQITALFFISFHLQFFPQKQ